jgi:hypothetical protein
VQGLLPATWAVALNGALGASLGWAAMLRRPTVTASEPDTAV